VTDELAGVETARSAGTGIGTREQHHVETGLVRAVNDRCFLSKPVEKLSAVSALGGISLQRSTPFRAPVVEGRVTEGPVNSEEGIDDLSIRTCGAVPNFPFPSGPQVVEFGLLHSSARPLNSSRESQKATGSLLTSILRHAPIRGPTPIEQLEVNVQAGCLRLTEEEYVE
jgi:hypothetical protein